jgi:hypothetical protein
VNLEIIGGSLHSSGVQSGRGGEGLIGRRMATVPTKRECPSSYKKNRKKKFLKLGESSQEVIHPENDCHVHRNGKTSIPCVA